MLTLRFDSFVDLRYNGEKFLVDMFDISDDIAEHFFMFLYNTDTDIDVWALYKNGEYYTIEECEERHPCIFEQYSIDAIESDFEEYYPNSFIEYDAVCNKFFIWISDNDPVF